MKSAIIAVGALFLASPLFAAETATVTVTEAPSGSNFQYNLTLDDTGTTNIGTLWFAWVPGEDFLTTSPVSETSPATWNAPAITHEFPGDGYAIQWVANTPLTPGQSLSGFSFITPDAPSSVEGNSSAYPGTPTETSFVYIGAPETDSGYEFVAQNVVPEPASILILGLGAGGLFLRPRRAR
jgi:hypothetical protein